MRRGPSCLALVVSAFVSAAYCGNPAFGDGAFRSPGEKVTDLPNIVALTAGDFNRDGRLDLTVLSASEAGQVLLRDPQQPSVWKKLPLATGSRGFFLRSADCDGDGDDDLLGADPAGGAYFLRSNGDGSFAAAAPVSQVFQPRWLTLADFDRDGALDLATADHGAAFITVHRGSGAGTFSILQQTSTSGQPHSIEALDYDGDGLFDLAAGVDPPPRFVFLKGTLINEQLVFKPSRAVNTGCYRFLEAGDFNGDGRGDLASGCQVEISGGDGTFQAVDLNAAHGELSYPLADLEVADVSDDGVPDIIVSGFVSVSIHAGRGDGSFRPPLTLAPITTAPPAFNSLAPPTILVRDLDADGHPDLVVPDVISSSLNLFRGKAGGSFEAGGFGIEGFGPAKVMAIADLDADGFQDVLLPAADQPSIRAYLRPGAPGASGSVRTIDSGDVYSFLEVGDLDGSGWLDLAGTRYAAGTVLTAMLDGMGRVKSRAALNAGAFPAAVGLGRLDGGAALDLIVPCSGSDHLAIFQGQGGGEYAPPTTVASILRLKSMVLGDLDGDGRLDAALISTEEAGVHFGTGNGGLSAPVIMAGDPARTFVDLAMADLDGDSLADLLCLEKTEGLSIFRNAGGRSFEAPPPLAVPGEAISLAAADLDGDGLAEATVAAHLTTVTGASGASMFVYRKRGESFVPDSGWAYALPFAPLGHKLADLDLDGTLDLVVFEYHTALVLFGNAAPAGTDLFRRGDSDAGGTIALTDAIAILNRLFLGGEALTCPDAADANDDGEINLSDPIAILFRLFLGGEPLPPPGPEDCGADLTPDGLPACLRGC